MRSYMKYSYSITVTEVLIDTQTINMRLTAMKLLKDLSVFVTLAPL